MQSSDTSAEEIRDIPVPSSYICVFVLRIVNYSFADQVDQGTRASKTLCSPMQQVKNIQNASVSLLFLSRVTSFLQA